MSKEFKQFSLEYCKEVKAQTNIWNKNKISAGILNDMLKTCITFYLFSHYNFWDRQKFLFIFLNMLL